MIVRLSTNLPFSQKKTHSLVPLFFSVMKNLRILVSATIVVVLCSAAYSAVDDETISVMAINQTTLPPWFECYHALIYAPDCHGRRLRSSGHSGGGGHSSGGGHSGAHSSAPVHTTPHASFGVRARAVVGSTATVYLLGDFSVQRTIHLQQNLDFCVETYNVPNNTISFDGMFVAACDHNRIEFWPVLFNAVQWLFATTVLIYAVYELFTHVSTKKCGLCYIV